MKCKHHNWFIYERREITHCILPQYCINENGSVLLFLDTERAEIFAVYQIPCLRGTRYYIKNDFCIKHDMLHISKSPKMDYENLSITCTFTVYLV